MFFLTLNSWFFIFLLKIITKILSRLFLSVLDLVNLVTIFKITNYVIFLLSRRCFYLSLPCVFGGQSRTCFLIQLGMSNPKSIEESRVFFLFRTSLCNTKYFVGKICHLFRLRSSCGQPLQISSKVHSFQEHSCAILSSIIWIIFSWLCFDFRWCIIENYHM